MSYSAQFVAGQLSFEDRSVSVDAPAGSPFRGLTVHSKLTSFAAYAPAASLPPKTRRIKVGGRTLEVMIPPTAYSHVYVTLVGPLQYHNMGVHPTELIVGYNGPVRLSYTIQSPIQLIGPSARIVEFDADVSLQVRRSAIEQFESIHIHPPAGALGDRLFPESKFSGGLFAFGCSWPLTGSGNVSIVHKDGFLYNNVD